MTANPLLEGRTFSAFIDKPIPYQVLRTLYDL